MERQSGMAVGSSNRTSKVQRSIHGFTLIEVLIALVLFSVGILGLVALQATATNLTTSAEDSTRAALLANEIATEMYNAGTVSLPAATVTAWQNEVNGTTASNLALPGGSGSVTTAGNVATIAITWSEAALTTSGNSSVHNYSGSHTYTTVVSLTTF
jgi:type IV pilus assembly protein PilV